MIPLSSDFLYEHKDEESGLVFFIRPIIGKNERKFFDASKKLTNLNDSDDTFAMVEIIDPLIDEMVAGWGDKKDISNASQCFRAMDKIKLFNVICELNGFKKEEVKN